MSWLALLLIGIAICDLAHSVRAARHLPQLVGAVTGVATGLLAGLTEPVDLIALGLVAGLVLAWGYAVTWAFGEGPTWLPMVVLVFALVLTVGVSASASPTSGLVGQWLEGVSLPILHAMDGDRFLLLVGALGIQLSTGNVVVRLVLKATGTVSPARDGSLPPTPLKGGRLLGPLERVFIVTLGLAGQVTAASIVVAAKGLLRFPELSSRHEQHRVHQMTEYFLVGSFVSWLVALACLVLLA